jgi:ORF6N domain
MAKRRLSEGAMALMPDRIAHAILVVRGRNVLLDSQLASFYGVETKSQNQAVKRNQERFPEDFMFQLSDAEFENWRSQIVTSNPAAKMGLRRRPYAFTEQGVAMLSSVLRSPRAVEVNIQIMRAFVRLRQLLSVHKELAERLAKLENRMHDRDQVVAQQFQKVFALLERLFNPPARPRKPIGFHVQGPDNE